MSFRKNYGLIILWATFIVSFLFVYNTAYHATKIDYLREVVLTLMASSVTLIITTLLLRQQTESEELKDTHSEIFRKKFEVYTDFIRTLIVSLEDKTNQDENLRRLEEDFYKLLLFINNQDTFDRIYEVIMKSLEDDDRGNIGEVLSSLRNELGIHGRIQSADFWSGLGSKMNAFCDAAEKIRKAQ